MGFRHMVQALPEESLTITAKCNETVSDRVEWNLRWVPVAADGGDIAKRCYRLQAHKDISLFSQPVWMSYLSA